MEKYFCTEDLDLAKELYEALDGRLTGVGLLPLGQVTSRPVLHKAIDKAHEVIDEAVKEERYRPDRIGGN